MSCPCKKAVNIFESASTPYRIGKTGENVYQEIEFNFSKWLSEYPDAKIDLLIRVPKNGFYLLAEGITEPVYVWKPTAFDLANPGRAAVMARMSSGEVRAKSDPIPFEIVRSMDYNLDISEPGPTRPSLMDEWIEDIYEAAARYPKIGEEDGYWYVWDVVEGDWVKTDTYAGGTEGTGGIVYISASSDYKVPMSASEIIDIVNDGKYPILNFIGLIFQYSGVDNGEPIFSATGIRRTNFVQSIQIRVHEDKSISYDTLEVGVKSVNGQTGEITKILSYAAQALTESEKAQARRNIDAVSISDLGIVFTLKGSVATVNDLPAIENRVGDVWYVESASVGFVWLTTTVNPNGYWEELGAPIDLSAYVDSETYATDMAQVYTELQDKLSMGNLQTELDDNVPPARFVLARNGNTLTTVDTFVVISNLLISTSRRVMFIIVTARSGGAVQSALELYPTMIDTNNRLLTLVGYYDGNRYTAELMATSPSSIMTGTLVVEPIVTQSDIPTAVSDLTNDSGYQTAPFEIEITESDSTFSTTATAQEVLDNADNCVAVLSGGEEVIKPDFIARNGSTVVSIMFTIDVVAGGSLSATQIVVTAANGNVTVVGNSARFTPLPDATSAIAGDFLRLDGQKQPVWETVPSVMGASIPLGD